MTAAAAASSLPFRLLLSSVCLLLLSFASPQNAAACAVCGAADKTLPAKGEEIAFAGRARVTLDGRAAGFAARYTDLRVTEVRLVPGAAYAIGDSLLLSADVPVLRRSLVAQERSSGQFYESEKVMLGDVEARASYTAWRSPTRRLSFFGGLKGPTAPIERDPKTGAYVPTDLQPGCGSIVPMIGATYTWNISSLISAWASASFLMPVSVRSGPHAGDSVRASTTMQLQPAKEFAARVGVHGRLDQSGALDDGMSDPKSGGGSLFVAPELAFNPAGDLIVSAGAAFPVAQATRGHRVTSPVALVGVGWDF